MDVLVSDTSVVIDLERADILGHVFALSYRFIVPDALSLAKAEAAILLAGGAAVSMVSQAVTNNEGDQHPKRR